MFGIGSAIARSKEKKDEPLETIVYTVVQGQQSRAMNLGHLVIDVRVGYGLKPFAMPTWLFNQHNNVHEGSAEELMDKYHAFLLESIENNPRDWEQLTKLKSLAVMCKMPRNSPYAHRMIFRNVVISYLQEKGKKVYHGGEILQTEYLSPEVVKYATA